MNKYRNKQRLGEFTIHKTDPNVSNKGGIMNKRVMVVFAMSLTLMLGAAGNLSNLVKKAKTKYAKFEQVIKDMKIVKETKIIGNETGMISESKVFKKGKKFRVETTMQMPQSSSMPGGMKTIVIYDGKDTWMISSMMGRRKLSDEDSRKYQREEDWWKTLSDAKITDTEMIGKHKCYVIKIKNEEEAGFSKIWLDKKLLNLIKAEAKGKDGSTMVWINSDFRKIKGEWEMPYKTEIYANGKLFTVSTVKSLVINKGISDNLFNPDKVKMEGPSNMQEMMKKAMEQGGG